MAKDSTNPEAREKLDLVDPLKRDVAYARQLYETGNYMGAIDLLAHPVEVSEQSQC